MPIAPKCVQRLNAAAGKTLTENQLAEIERRMRRTSTMLAREDIDAWRAMSPDKRILAAAERAQADIKAEAQLKVERAKLQLAKTAATEERIGRQQRLHGKDGRTQSLIRDLEETERYVEAVKREVTADMLDAIKAAGDKQGAGMGRKVLIAIFDADNPAMTKDLAIEIYGNADGSTGNAIARAGAKAWLDAMETMRQRFNSAGGDVGKLDYGYLPQPHDQARVLRAGPDKWSAQVLPLLDRSRYLNEDGSRMSDAQVLDFLKAAHDTIATGGANKREPGAFAGTGARANRGAESREIHFASGDAYLQYLAKYGGGSMFDAMVGHVAQRARDIALVERYGPNPANQMRLQMDLAARADKTNVGEGRKFLATVDTYWNIVSGNANMVAGRGTLAQFGGGVRNIQVAGKLAGAVLSSLPDIGTYMVTVGYNRLPWFDALKNIAKANSADARAELDAHGLMAESLMASLNRWTGENVRDGITGRLANATMKLSLMNVWTDSLRRAFGLTMMQGTAKMHGKAWAALDEYDRFRLESGGITEADWQVINAAKLDDLDGRPMLTPEAVREVNDPNAAQVATKLLALYVDESYTAVVNPDLATRALSTGGEQRGTVRGELWRTAMQFKSFPIAMISRHWRRAIEAPGASNRLAYASALGLSLTLLGAMSFQAKEMARGKDPVDMTQPKFWVKAMSQGGAAGFYGDLMLENTKDSLSRADPLFRLLGPTAGSTADLYELTKGNFDEWSAGKDTKAGAEALRFAQSHAPFINLWYLRTALERALINDLHENLSPGYLARMKQRARKDYGNEFWWEPGDAMPDRAPDFANAVGQ